MVLFIFVLAVHWNRMCHVSTDIHGQSTAMGYADASILGLPSKCLTVVAHIRKGELTTKRRTRCISVWLYSLISRCTDSSGAHEDLHLPEITTLSSHCIVPMAKLYWRENPSSSFYFLYSSFFCIPRSTCAYVLLHQSHFPRINSPTNIT